MGNQSRLLWRCRRGLREMDLLLEAYVRRCYPELGEEEQRQFEAFLNETDPDILSWVMNRAAPDNAAYRKFVRQLQRLNNPGQDTEPGEE